jgi:hypothetical protein
MSTVAATAAELRACHKCIRNIRARVTSALPAFFALWQRRLAEGWTPPPGSPFPWEMVRLGVEGMVKPALTPRPPLPILGEGVPVLPFSVPTPAQRTSVIDTPSPRIGRGGRGVRAGLPPLAALLLAGNTPLLAWQPLVACLRAGYAVYVKMSRDETLWPRLFVEALAEVDPELAGLIHLDTWPGEDPRTAELVQTADVAIAYGSDTTIAALRKLTPTETPFYGYGHAVSVGLIGWDAFEGPWEQFQEALSGFARDVLMYDQQGCLSPQAIFTEASTGHVAISLGKELPEYLAREAERLRLPPVTDPAIARHIREARDLALFDGFHIHGDDQLRWTVAYTGGPRALPPPVTHGFIHVIPLYGKAELLPSRMGVLAGRISSVGVAGEITPNLRQLLSDMGVSRICGPGEMQTPPLDWPNGGFDLYEALASLNSVSTQ